MVLITAHYLTLIPIVEAPHRGDSVQFYKWGILLQSFLSLIGIENTTTKGNNTLFDFLLDYFLIKTTVGILILESQESMIIPLHITSWAVPKQVVFLANNMYLQKEDLSLSFLFKWPING